MDTLKINTGDWIVACDGHKALILKNTGSRANPKLHVEETHEQSVPRTSELGSDRPGRVQESVGSGARSAVGQTDWHDQAEQEFLIALARLLDARIKEGFAGSIVVAASPRALGVLREAYTPAVRKAVMVEVAKDYVNLPVPEIERFLLKK